MTAPLQRRLPWFVARDLDGFFGLAMDNLIQLFLISAFCRTLLGMSSALVFHTILPACGFSIVIGNVAYAYLARRLARQTGRDDITALPYGINTVSLFGYIFLVMLPALQLTHDPVAAWRVGVLACLGSGVIELTGAFVAEPVRRWIPRAALLASLAGIAITFIAMDFILRIFAQPLLAFVPLAILLLCYLSGIRLRWGLPGGLVAVVIGLILAVILRRLPVAGVEYGGLHWAWPQADGWAAIWSLGLAGMLPYLSVILPMGLFNVVGSLQNIESAAAAGDPYPTKAPLIINGLGTIAAALCGSPFPTTIYIGHPGWKAMGARGGYSWLNGLCMMLVCLTGSVLFLQRWVPLEVGIGILLWIGVIITAQAFQDTPRHHAPAVAIGLIPPMAAWGLYMLEIGLRAGGQTWGTVNLASLGQSIAIQGLIALERGFIFTSILWAAMAVFLIERQFLRATWTAVALAAAASTGLIHTYTITSHGILSVFGWGLARPFAAAYLACALVFWFIHYTHKARPDA